MSVVVAGALRKSSKERVVEPREVWLMSFDREVGYERYAIYARGMVVVECCCLVVIMREGTGDESQRKRVDGVFVVCLHHHHHAPSTDREGILMDQERNK